MRDLTVLFLVALTIALMSDFAQGIDQSALIGWLK